MIVAGDRENECIPTMCWKYVCVCCPFIWLPVTLKDCTIHSSTNGTGELNLTHCELGRHRLGVNGSE